MAMRIATLDVGTNTSLLLVADIDESGALMPVYDEQRFVRLGHGVDANKRINEAAFERLRETLLVQRDTAFQYGAEVIVVGATSASRDAVNRQELVDFVHDTTGLNYEILSGEEEAGWTFLGSVSAFEGLESDCFVIDIGGGSTEVIRGNAALGDSPEKAIQFKQSMNIGTVRLTERVFSSQPPPVAEVESVVEMVMQTLQDARIPGSNGLPVIAAAGTARTLGQLFTGETSWDERKHKAVQMDLPTLHEWRERLLSYTYDEVLDLSPAVLNGRADVFPTGLLLLETVLSYMGATNFRITPRGLRHGLALRFIQQRNR